MKIFSLKTFALVAMLFAAVTVMAQGERTPESIAKTAVERMTAGLKLTPDQQKKVYEYQLELGKVLVLKGKERQAANIEGVRKSVSEKILNVLDDTQRPKYEATLAKIAERQAAAAANK